MISGIDREQATADVRRIFGRSSVLAKTSTGVDLERVAERCVSFLERHDIAGERSVATVARYAVEQVEYVQTTARARTGAEIANYVCSCFRGAIGRAEALPRLPEPGLDWAAERKCIAQTFRQLAAQDAREAWSRADAVSSAEAAQRLGVAMATLHRPDFDRDMPVGVLRAPIRRRPRRDAIERATPRGPGTLTDALAEALDTEGHFFVPPMGAHGEDNLE